MIGGVLLDLSGVIYVGDHALPGAIDALGHLRQSGLPLRFLTNTTRSPKSGILARLHGMGVTIGEDELFTPARVACDYLAAHDLTAHLLIHPNLAEDFAGLSGRGGQAVVIGDAGEAFTYDRLNTAFRLLIGGAEFLALAANRSFKDRDGELSLDAGAFVAALEFASQGKARVLGKPAPAFFAAALASIDCPADRAVMVGDDAEADVSGALAAGLASAILVRSGKYQAGDEDRVDPRPTAVVDDFAAAVAWITSHQGS